MLVNTIGAYRGMRPLIGDQKMYLEINADGDWTAIVMPLPANDAYTQGMDGTGDFVSDLFMPAQSGPVPFTYKYDGKRNFIVEIHCAGGDDVVANEIGATECQAVVRVTDGPCLWEVRASGAWSVKPK